ncbi:MULTISPECIES: carbohydrate ABC transporter permease [unclassified Microbacterium]|uniref:carbohydrate ABC transporter permease n=1 Tax=unclassified Microbacterium TaxID=2609290 RepID=UPI00257F91BE|nr:MULTISPECIES: carbohydrate ABC transporter permease [unclassified Microbacterium]|tara:strand:- start:81 stop:1016 length:936 start_codon:yes stop_codon:yes gene_type:complete
MTTQIAPAPETAAHPSVAPSPHRRRQVYAEGERPSRTARTVGWIFMIAVTLYFLVPVYWLIVASTKSTGDLFSTPGFLFAEFNLWQNLVDLTEQADGIYWRWMFNSLIYSGLGSVLMTFISVISGYALAMYRFRGRTVILAAALGSMLVPQTVLAQPTYVLLVEMGLNNTMWGVLLPSLVYPFGVMLGFIYAQTSVPMELLEAARLDGASEWRAFWSIALKLLTPGAVTILLFAFIGSWNNFMLPLLVLSDARLQPVTVGLSGWSQAAITIPGLQTLVIVGSLLSIIPIIIVFVSLQRYWRSGLAAGGMKF